MTPTRGMFLGTSLCLVLYMHAGCLGIADGKPVTIATFFRPQSGPGAGHPSSPSPLVACSVGLIFGHSPVRRRTSTVHLGASIVAQHQWQCAVSLAHGGL